MELRQLRYAVAVATHRHFTKAAASIPVAQPALSHQIRLLELELGVELFERPRGGVRLTEAGEIFVLRARRALAEVEAVRDEIAALKGLSSGRLVLGAMQALAGLDLPRLISAFHAEHPASKFRCGRTRPATCSRWLRAARFISRSLPSTLSGRRPRGRPLVREPVLMAVPASHRLAREESVALQQFRDDAFVFFKRGTGLRATTERAADQAGFTPRVAFETGSLDRLLALVSEGLGVALVPSSTIRALQPPRVAVLPLSPAISRTVGAVWRAGHRHTPATSAFLALLRDHASLANPMNDGPAGE